MTCRILVEPADLRAGPLEVEGETYGYLFRVRRLAAGEALVVFDGAGREAPARIATVGPTRATLELDEPRAITPALPRVTIVQALIKGERMDWCLEKLTEVGVDEIIPCTTARTIVRLDDHRRASRHARHASIIREASRQAQRAAVPHIRDVVPLASALRTTAADLRVIASPLASVSLVAAAAAVTPAPTSVAIAIGPEGGFAPDELDLAASSGWLAISLGATVLRAETAGPIATALLRGHAPTR